MAWEQEKPTAEQTKERPRGGIPRVSMGELTPVDKLTPGFYTCPVKRAGKLYYGDYRRIGEEKGLPFTG